MKVLLISNMYPSKVKPYAGVFVKNQFEELSSMMEQTSDEIDIYYMKRSFTGPIGSLWKYFMVFVKFTPYYFKKYDVVHLHYFYPLIILCWIYKIFHPKSKVMVTFHGGDINTQINGGLNQTVFQFLAKCIDLAIPVGQALEQAVHQKLNMKRTKVLCAGVDHRVFYPPETPRDKKYDFVFVGTFEIHKGIDFIVEAISNLKQNTFRFCFIGSGSLLPQIEALSEFQDVTIFANLPQSEIREIFFESRFHFLPSRMEAFGLVVSEAMFCGVPSIVTNVGGLPEQIDDGVSGFICQETSGKGLLLAFERALAIGEHEYQTMSQEAMKNKSKFSLESVCQTQLDLYHSMSQGV